MSPVNVVTFLREYIEDSKCVTISRGRVLLQDIKPEFTHRTQTNEFNGFAAITLVLSREESFIFLSPDDQAIRICPEIFCAPICSLTCLDVHSKVGPAHPDSLGTRFDNADKTVGFLSPPLVHELSPARVSFEELVTQAGAGRQFKPRAVTSLVREYQAVGNVLPENNISFARIDIRVGGGWELKALGSCRKHNRKLPPQKRRLSLPWRVQPWRWAS